MSSSPSRVRRWASHLVHRNMRMAQAIACPAPGFASAAWFAAWTSSSRMLMPKLLAARAVHTANAKDPSIARGAHVQPDVMRLAAERRAMPQAMEPRLNPRQPHQIDCHSLAPGVAAPNLTAGAFAVSWGPTTRASALPSAAAESARSAPAETLHQIDTLTFRTSRMRSGDVAVRRVAAALPGVQQIDERSRRNGQRVRGSEIANKVARDSGNVLPSADVRNISVQNSLSLNSAARQISTVRIVATIASVNIQKMWRESDEECTAAFSRPPHT
jgi:hypothetical protein